MYFHHTTLQGRNIYLILTLMPLSGRKIQQVNIRHMPTIHDTPLRIHMQVDQELIPKKNGVETCHSLVVVHFSNGSEAVRVVNVVPKSKLRKWLARKVRIWDALVPHWACLPGHPHAVSVCVMFEIQLLARTAPFYCSHFCERKENNN